VKYRHSFHAGNFADTVKHLVLLALVKSLARKPAPFFYLETHAGRGRYKLSADNAEFAAGFGRLRGQKSLPPLLAEYVALVEALGSDGGALESYAGSPLLAANLLRAEDRAMLFELGTLEAEHLQDAVRPFHNVSVQCGDGYTGLRAQVPPRERRGMVLIDPAYELQDKEFPVLLKALTDAHRRWATGTYAIWYPIKRHASLLRFHEDVRQTGLRKILCAQLTLYPDDSRVSLNGCGMMIVNPPWQMDEMLTPELPVLHALLNPQPGTSAECFWLVPE
jgi:23S rRNA (adenine2030-N6)-methyltransferase